MADTAHAPIHVLIAYDGSEGAADAIKAAGQLFQGARASVLHVADVPAAEEHAAFTKTAVPNDTLVLAARDHEQSALVHARNRAEAGRRLAERAGLRATAEMWRGSSAWREVRRAAQDLHADVVVCGSRGRGAFSRALLGSTSSSLLHHADCPVLVVPAGSGDLEGPTVIAYDGSDGAGVAIDAAARLLPARPAVVVHVSSSGAVAPPDRELAEQGATLAQEAGLTVRALAAEGSEGAWHALAQAAHSETAAVVVAGCRGRGAVASTVLGSVSAGLAHNADLPVLIVR